MTAATPSAPQKTEALGWKAQVPVRPRASPPTVDWYRRNNWWSGDRCTRRLSRLCPRQYGQELRVLRFQRLDTRIDGLVLVPAEGASPTTAASSSRPTARNEYADLGIDAEFVQDDRSRSVRDTIRALHFQLTPGQAKLIRVARGSIYDVAVDLRRDSPTYGQFEAFELSDENAHPSLHPDRLRTRVLRHPASHADVAYKVSSYYDQATERGIAWNDPNIGIP